MAGAYDVAIAGGIESMSRVPMGSARGGADPFGPSVRNRYPVLVPQGIAAELVCEKWQLSRAQLDEYAARSHTLAAAARDGGSFGSEIVPVPTAAGTAESDETIRDTTTPGRLAELAPAFARPPYDTQFPDLTFRITAGNSCREASAGLANRLTEPGALSARRSSSPRVLPRTAP
jgi:acetyl-CoA acyltransferase